MVDTSCLWIVYTRVKCIKKTQILENGFTSFCQSSIHNHHKKESSLECFRHVQDLCQSILATQWLFPGNYSVKHNTQWSPQIYLDIVRAVLQHFQDLVSCFLTNHHKFTRYVVLWSTTNLFTNTTKESIRDLTLKKSVATIYFQHWLDHSPHKRIRTLLDYWPEHSCFRMVSTQLSLR